MKRQMGLGDYWKELPDSMTLKKKVIKAIMHSDKPLSQKEILGLLESKDWTNVKRVIRDILDEGLIVRKYIGTKEYYIKVEFHKKSAQFDDGDYTYFIDMFEPDYEDKERYFRIKQAIRLDRDNFETFGKITIRESQFRKFLGALGKITFTE